MKCFQASNKKSKQVIADAYMTFQGTRGARHGVQPWHKHHYIAKEIMRKIHKKGIYTSVLDRFQNDEVFHASQLQHNWTKAMVRIFGLRQNNRYFAKCTSGTIGTIRTVVSFSVRSETNGESSPLLSQKKAPRLPSNNTGYCQHEQRSGSDSRIEKTT